MMPEKGFSTHEDATRCRADCGQATTGRRVLRPGLEGARGVQGISEQSYYRWRIKYGGMNPQMARQLRTLEKENGRLKKLVADQALDIQILKEAVRPNC